MIRRNVQTLIEKALVRSPVVLITGARQTGKTTLAQQIAQNHQFSYVTFDDIRFLSAAQRDPIGFIAGLTKPVILDEVQRVPEIFLSIKQDVDANRKPGMYILTGSANPLLLPRLGDSLAGRMEIFNLFPLSQGELLGIQENFIDTLFNKQLPHVTKKFSLSDFYTHLDIGGFPLVQNLDEQARESWFNGYVTTLLQRDVKDIAQISGLAELPNLLHILALRTSNLLNAAELSRVSGIPSTTLHRYLVLLQALFLVQLELPWSSNRGKRLVRSPKINLIDTGLISFLTGTSVTQNRLENRMLGPIVENFVVNELYKQATWNTTRVRIFHYRTNTGIEVDIILENRAGDIVALEVKNSSTVTAQDFKGLSYLANLMGEKFLHGIVLYTGSASVPFGTNLHALPISALWKKT